MSTIVYGGSLAALVAADQLTAASEPVVLVTPTPHLGGHFAGTTLGGASFDAGLVIFEFGALNASGFPDPVTYNPDARNDCGRFGNVLASYTASLGITLERTPGFLLWSEGRLIPDFVFDTRLDGVRALPAWVRDHAAAEVAARLTDPEHPLHARRKYLEPRYGSLSYEDASLANHGTVLHHACFEPFAEKVTGGSSRDVLALYSRAAWLPLFWPETLAAAFGGQDDLLPEMPFHAARGGAVRDLVMALIRRLDAAPTLTRVVSPALALRADDAGIRLDHAHGSLTAERIIWGHDLETLARLTGQDTVPDVQRAPVTIVLALVSRTDVASPEIGTVILPQDRALPYRITNQSANAGVPDESLVRLSIEWGGADAPADDDALLALTQSALARIGLTRPDAGFVAHKVLRIPRALVVPSAANRDAILAMRQHAEATGLPILPVAPAAGFGVASLNDQLVQGMKAARLALDAGARTMTNAVPQADGADPAAVAA